MEMHSVRSVYVSAFIGLILLIVSTYQVSGDKCAELMNIDCETQYKPEGNETLCCSDYRVYKNLCFFAQAKCLNPTLTSLYPGDCSNTSSAIDDSNVTISTTTLTTPTAHVSTTVDVIHSVFCDYESSLVCPDSLDPICGSDNKFYKNQCCFAKAQCKDTALHIQSDLDICKVATRFRRDQIDVCG